MRTVENPSLTLTSNAGAAIQSVAQMVGGDGAGLD